MKHLILILSLLATTTQAATPSEAELLALETSGALLPPEALVQRIETDLALIRQHYPAMQYITYSGRWQVGVLSVGLTDTAMAQYQNSDYHGLDDLNVKYGPVDITEIASINLLTLQFEQSYNPEYLAPLYKKAEGVRYATPDWLIGDSSGIQANPPEYTFKKAWGDCFAGCINQHFWRFKVNDNTVELLEEYGSPLPDDLTIQTPALEIEPDTLIAGKQLSFTLRLHETIEEVFDFYLVMEALGIDFTLSFDGSIMLGVMPLYTDIPPGVQPFELPVTSQVALPRVLRGETISFYAIAVQTGKNPPVETFAEMQDDTPHVLMLGKAVATVE